MVTFKNDRFHIKIYLDKGLLVHVEGVDRETKLIREIAKRKDVDPTQVSELEKIKEKDPLALGQTLINLGLLSESGWDKFLVFRARYHLARVLMMEKVAPRFIETSNAAPTRIPVNRNFIELLMDTIRDIKDKAFFQKFVPGLHAVFQKTEEGKNLGDWVTLTSNEQVALSVVDGKKTLADISSSTGLTSQELYQAFYLLLFLNLISPLQANGKETQASEHSEFIKLYLDFVKIIDTHFRSEIGRQFEKIFLQCTKELIEKGDKFFQGIDLSDKAYEKSLDGIFDHFSSLLNSGESPLVVFTSLNKLVYLLIMRMKKTLGTGITQNAVNEMLKMLTYVEKYSRDQDIMNYVRGNLEDYARQVGA